MSLYTLLSKLVKVFIWSLTSIVSFYPFYVAYDLKETHKKYVPENHIAGDYEYDAWREYAVLLAGMNVVYLVSCQFVRRHLPKRYHKPFRLAIGISMLSGVISVNAMALMVTYMMLFFGLIILTKSKLVT